MSDRTITFKVSVTAPRTIKEADLRGLIETTLEPKIRRIAGTRRGQQAIRAVRLRNNTPKTQEAAL